MLTVIAKNKVVKTVTISADILNQLTQLKEQVDQYRPLSQIQVEQLEAQIRYEHVWSSNAIEGNTLSKYETTSILQTGLTVHGKPIKDVLETLDLNAAYNYMQDLASHQQPLFQQIIRDLNRFVTTKTAADYSSAGEYRAINVRPNGLEDHPYVDPFDIRPAMTDLIDWTNTAKNRLHPVIYAANLHQKFVSIHPFADGNGRTARLLMNLALTEAGYPVINIQPDKTSRDAYMDALEVSRRTGNLDSFEMIIATYSKHTLEQRVKTLQLNEQNLKDAERDADR